MHKKETINENEGSAAVKKIRKALKMTQATVARTLGISIRAIQSYEQGWRDEDRACGNSPKVRNIIAYSETIGLTNTHITQLSESEQDLIFMLKRSLRSQKTALRAVLPLKNKVISRYSNILPWSDHGRKMHIYININIRSTII